jgi:Transglycosylase SLT domain
VAAVASGVVALWPASPASPASPAARTQRPATADVAAAAGGLVNGGLASGEQLTVARLRDVVYPARRHGLRYGRIAGIGLVYTPVFMQLQRQHEAEVLARKRAAQRRARLAAEAAAAAAAANSAGQSSGGSPGTAAVPTGSPQQIAMAMLGSYGWSSSEFSCLDQLWTRESGWNPQAANPYSGAFGIPQALPGSKMASAGADWATNPATQIRWGLGYIRETYGTPCAAWSHSLATGAY